jgi:hypothetical protein
MEGIFTTLSLALFVAVWATMFRIVQDVSPHLSEQHRECLRHWTRWNHSFGCGGAIRTAWDEHIKMFPNSRKRVLLAVLLVALALSVIPLSLAVALH